MLENVSKDKHLLTTSTLNPRDRQNFSSVLKICDDRVRNLLSKNVKDSEATVMYLEMMKNIIESYVDVSLTPLNRIEKMWYSLFMIRLWREYISSRPSLTLKDNFLTQNCYACIEINAHSLILLITFLKNNGMSEYFLPHLLTSQPCESTFRQIRSFTSTFSTVVNCSVKEILGRINKIQLQNDIVQNLSSTSKFVFPRFDPLKSEQKNMLNLPTPEEICNQIEKCKKNAISDAAKIGLLTKKKTIETKLSCNLIQYIPKEHIKANQAPQKSKNILKQILPLLKNIELKDYSEKTKKQINAYSPFISLFNGNRNIVVRKNSLCWLMQKDCGKISSDRLERVKGPKCKFVKKRTNNKAFTCSKATKAAGTVTPIK